MRPGDGCVTWASAGPGWLPARSARCSRCGTCPSASGPPCSTLRQPFKPTTWRAALTVAWERAEGDLGRVTVLGRRRFGAAVRRQVARWDAVHPWQKIIDAVFGACADPAGVPALRRGALERVALLL